MEQDSAFDGRGVFGVPSNRGIAVSAWSASPGPIAILTPVSAKESQLSRASHVPLRLPAQRALSRPFRAALFGRKIPRVGGVPLALGCNPLAPSGPEDARPQRQAGPAWSPPAWWEGSGQVPSRKAVTSHSTPNGRRKRSCIDPQADTAEAAGHTRHARGTSGAGVVRRSIASGLTFSVTPGERPPILTGPQGATRSGSGCPRSGPSSAWKARPTWPCS